MSEMDAQKQNRDDIKEACLDSYATFCCLMQDDGWFDDVHRELCDWAQKQFFNCLEEIKVTGMCNGKLLIIMPRGSLKSTIVTKYLPVWITTYLFYREKDSGTRSLIAGNTYTNAKKKLKNIRSLVDDVPLFGALFPEMLPKKGRDGNKWSDEAAEINRTGSYEEATWECAGTNTKLTGRHYNIIVEDDTTAPDVDEMKEAMTLPSSDTIEKAIGFHKSTIPLQVPKGLRLSIVVSTRWAMDDLVQYLMEKEDYKYFNKPAKDKQGRNNFNCFYGDAVLEEIKKRIGTFMFHMLYLNEPQDPSTRIFNKENFQYVDKEDVPKAGYKTICIDPAIGEGEEACDSSITVAQHHDNGGKHEEYWWEDSNGKYLPFELAKEALRLADKHHTDECPIKEIIVEGNAYQTALKYIIINLQEERRAKGKRVYQVGTFTSGSNSGKHLRIRGLQPSFEQKRIYFVKLTLSDQTESQLIQYPNGKLVDTIDCWSMHKKAWRKDKFETVEEFEEVDEMSFEAACASIRKRMSGSSDVGFVSEDSIAHEFCGLESCY